MLQLISNKRTKLEAKEIKLLSNMTEAHLSSAIRSDMLWLRGFIRFQFAEFELKINVLIWLESVMWEYGKEAV